MASHPLRLVVDTNVLLAGLVSKSSASQKIIDWLQARKAIPLISSPVLAEYRAVLCSPAVRERFAHLTTRRVELALHRLRYIGEDYRHIRARFRFDRDPRDAMFIEVAIAREATHIITMDADLLSLPTSRAESGKRFRQRLPHIKVERPQTFVENWGKAIGLV